MIRPPPRNRSTCHGNSRAQQSMVQPVARKENSMKCAVHPDVDATGYCRNCGKPMCPGCIRPVRDVLYCEDCLATILGHPANPSAQAAPAGYLPQAPVAAVPPIPPAGIGPNPVLAF